jgi:DNA-binding transcriptional LysR family regulator
MDLLSALRVFVRVAEAGSFSAASRLLGSSQPSVSRQIALVEQHFDVRLFSRTTRSLTITADGHSLLGYARQLFDTLDSAEMALGRRRGTAQGLVRLGATTAFGLFLTRRIDQLLQDHPGLVVELVMRDSFGDMVEEGLDLAVRIGLPTETSLIVRHLGDVPTVLVASSAYAAAHALPDDPDALPAHPCIAYTYGSGQHRWQFARDGLTRDVPAAGPFRANNSEAVHQAVLAGLGIALLPEYQVQEDLASGRLARVMPDWRTPVLPLHATFPGPRTLPLRTRTVLDFLVALPIVQAGAETAG